MAPLRDSKEMRDFSMVAVEAAASMAVLIPILFSMMICGCCCKGKNKDKKSQKSQRNIADQPPAEEKNANLQTSRIHPRKTADMNKSFARKSIEHRAGTPMNLSKRSSPSKSELAAIPEGSQVKSAKTTSSKSGSSGKSPSSKVGKDTGTAKPQEVLEYASDDDPRYKSMVELESSGK